MKNVPVKWGDPAPFDAYLLVKEQDNPGYVAFQVLDLLDIEELLQKALEVLYYGYDVQLETCRQYGGSNYACIITDSRPTDSVVVWDSCDFYFTLDE